MAVRFKKSTHFISVLLVVAALSNEGLSSSYLEDAPVTSDELKQVMSEGSDPQRLDRRPGFSTITYAQPDSLSASGEENGRGYLDYSDQAPSQAGEPEAEPFQR